PQKKAPPTGDPVVFAGLNFRYLQPSQGWFLDDRTKDKLRNTRLVLRQHAPPAWFAILVKDFRARNPRPRERHAEAVYALEQYFTENLASEYDDKATFQGRPAQRLVFQGQVNRQTYAGECWMFGHLGFGYWLVSWAAGDEVKRMAPDFDDLRQRFAFGDERK